MRGSGGDIGCSVGPYVTGNVSDTVIDIADSVPWMADVAASLGLSNEQLGLRSGFLAAVIFPLMMLIGVLLLSRSGKRSNAKKQ